MLYPHVKTVTMVRILVVIRLTSATVKCNILKQGFIFNNNIEMTYIISKGKIIHRKLDPYCNNSSHYDHPFILENPDDESGKSSIELSERFTYC